MNSKDFIQILRTVINQEVRKVIKEELGKLKLNEIIQEEKQPQQIISDNSKSKYVPGTIRQKYVSDPMLNSILNETAATPPPDEPVASVIEKQTGVPELDAVFNRDYSQLVSRFNKK